MWKFPFNKIMKAEKKNPIQPPHPQKTIKYLISITNIHLKFTRK
jgi:hypothetical protein